MNYLITGSTGLIGKVLIDTIIRESDDGRTMLVLPVRNIAKAKERFACYKNVKKVHIVYVECDLLHMTKERFDLDFPIDYLIHCAAPTSSSHMLSNPVETADAVVLGTKNALELARHLNVAGMVCLSSMEVYGVVEDEGVVRKEEELGKIDLSNPRCSYPMGKRMAEHYCHIYQKEYGVPVKIARLSQVFGKGVRKSDDRVFMQFARAVVGGKDIILKTAGKSLGNYCETEDAVRAVLTILEQGEEGAVYNVVNEENTMSIWEMANLVADRIAGRRIQVRVCPEDSSKTGYAPDTGLRLSGDRLRALGWKPQKNLMQMYADVLKEMV
ncbi:MAG: NAD(P)-dependent oxidoreductase [Lachnospiraceae bacterium]|nr:NAD(P)-dependent oxidoreductase [Lachnospiraceae bacterium]